MFSLEFLPRSLASGRRILLELFPPVPGVIVGSGRHFSRARTLMVEQLWQTSGVVLCVSVSQLRKCELLGMATWPLETSAPTKGKPHAKSQLCLPIFRELAGWEMV